MIYKKDVLLRQNFEINRIKIKNQRQKYGEYSF